MMIRPVMGILSDDNIAIVAAGGDWIVLRKIRSGEKSDLPVLVLLCLGVKWICCLDRRMRLMCISVNPIVGKSWLRRLIDRFVICLYFILELVLLSWL